MTLRNQAMSPPIRHGATLFFVLFGALSAGEKPVSFSSDIRPIFENSCWKCHGGSTQQSNLDLRTRENALKGGVRGPALAPGKAEESRLFRMISGLDKPGMPMGAKLTPEQISSIKDWINQGAAWETAATAQDTDPRNYWAFRKPERRAPPAPGHPVDAFLEKTWTDKGLRPAPPADRTTLLRRAFLDLIGLPPSPAEAAEFLNDKAPDAWERLIDQLLASPHYGERWGRHWLDVARYADSNGFEHDFNRPNAWRYRDYVIRAFNQDKPYDVFLREQIAGDELDKVTNDSLIATGFLRNYAKVGFREKDNPEFRYEYLDDMISTIGRGILGLTVQCARCHDHKFDPIPQTDYYRMQASLFSYVEVDHPLTAAAEAAAYEKNTAAIDARVKELRGKIKSIEQPYRDVLLPEKYKRFPSNVQEAISTPAGKRTPGQTLLANQVLLTVSVASEEINRIMKPLDLAAKRRLEDEVLMVEKERPPPIPVAMGITDGDYRYTPDGPGDEPAPGKGVKHEADGGSFLFQGPGKYQAPPSYLLIRGDVSSRGSEMQPGFVTVATYGNPPTALQPANGRTSGRRRALAEWLVSPDNPLTARVLVNRIWQHHFGRGLAATLDNFGKMGETPTHPELLDWLATEFIARGWSIKQMHRLLMTSKAYKMSSRFEDPVDLSNDSENRFLWRFRIQRLDAEIVRDSILAASGALNRQMGGPPVFPKLAGEVLDSMKYGIWEPEEDGAKVWRRSVYVYRKRGLPFPLFEAFDLPEQNTTCGARNTTTVPTQALMLLNDEFVLRQATLFTKRVREAAGEDRARQLDLAYRIALARPPAEEERKLGSEFLEKHTLADLTHVLLNLNEFLYMR